MSAPGSTAAYDDLAEALHSLLAHEKLAGVLGVGPTARAFADAERARLDVFMDAATLCGWEPREGPPIAWAQRRLDTFERTLGGVLKGAMAPATLAFVFEDLTQTHGAA